MEDAKTLDLATHAGIFDVKTLLQPRASAEVQGLRILKHTLQLFATCVAFPAWILVHLRTLRAK